MAAATLAQQGEVAPSSETQAIRAILDAQVEAWNKGNAQAFAASFNEEGWFTNQVGMSFRGRKQF